MSAVAARDLHPGDVIDALRVYGFETGLVRSATAVVVDARAHSMPGWEHLMRLTLRLQTVDGMSSDRWGIEYRSQTILSKQDPEEEFTVIVPAGGNIE